MTTTSRTPRLTALIIRTSLEKGISAGHLYKGLRDSGYTKREIAQGFCTLIEEVEPCL